MKKVLMAVALVVTMAGFATAQTKPATEQKKSPKKEMASTAKETPARDNATHHHAKKHHAKKH